VSRRSLVWLLTLPLAILGSQVAHGLAYRLATRDDTERARELATSGHAYLAYVPLFLGVCAALVVLALARELGLLLAGRTGRSARPSALSFAVLGPAIFVAQEHIERFAHGGAIATTLVLEPSFALGLVLQVPFALVAYALARLLLRATRAMARLLDQPRANPARASSCWRSTPAFVPRTKPNGLTFGPRGPPLHRAV
jgi:hypothetical protein